MCIWHNFQITMEVEVKKLVGVSLKSLTKRNYSDNGMFQNRYAILGRMENGCFGINFGQAISRTL